MSAFTNLIVTNNNHKCLNICVKLKYISNISKCVNSTIKSFAKFIDIWIIIRILIADYYQIDSFNNILAYVEVSSISVV